MPGANKLLERLDRPRQTRPGRWVAGCPCCRSRWGRPLSVREIDDGTILLHAFCGCTTEAVLVALGLTLADLFPEKLTGNGADQFRPAAPRIPARDLLAVVSEEVSVIAIVAADMLERRAVGESDWQRFTDATRRIQHAQDYLHGCY